MYENGSISPCSTGVWFAAPMSHEANQRVWQSVTGPLCTWWIGWCLAWNDGSFKSMSMSLPASRKNPTVWKKHQMICLLTKWYWVFSIGCTSKVEAEGGGILWSDLVILSETHRQQFVPWSKEYNLQRNLTGFLTLHHFHRFRPLLLRHLWIPSRWQ